MDNKIYVAFTGFARSGKDSFCEQFEKQIMDNFPAISCEKGSFAEGLRREVFSFLQEQFGISAWTEDTKEKEIIRHFLRGYGMSRRASDHLYFIKALDERLQYSHSDVILVSDLRFAVFEEDELTWLHNKKKKLHVHIARYKNNEDGRLVKVEAPNEDEEENESKLEEAADLVLNLPWEDDIEDFGSVVEEKSKEILMTNIKLFL